MTSSPTRVLAVDIGTSSVRAMVYDAAGAIHARARICYSTIRPAPYFEEQDPDLVRAEVYRAIALCLSRPGAEPGRIAAMGFSSQLYGVIALDEDDRPLTRNILWSDGRAEAQAEAAKREFGDRWLYPETGCPLNSIFPFAKIAWLRQEAPHIHRAARRFVSIKEYVTWPLIGEWAVDYSMASATGMLDIRKHGWSRRALDHLELDAGRLPLPVSGTKRFALKADSPLAACGMPAGVAVFLGGGDGPLANLGSGASTPGSVNIDLGTSGAVRCITDAPRLDETASLWCFCLTDEIWTFGGIVTNVGNAYEWLGTKVIGAGRLTEDEAYALMNRGAGETPPGADGLFFLPYLRKARSPYWDGRLKGTLYGLTANHDAGHIARALLEAVTFDLRAIMDIVRRESPTVPQVVLTGGLSRSPIIPRLLADVLNCELSIPEDGEGSIAGAAILALHGLGAIETLAFAGGPRPGASCRPDPENAQRYERTYRAYSRLVGVLREIDLQERESP